MAATASPYDSPVMGTFYLSSNTTNEQVDKEEKTIDSHKDMIDEIIIKVLGKLKYYNTPSEAVDLSVTLRNLINARDELNV